MPREFMQLSTKAAESRQRAQLLYASAAAAERLPIRVSVAGRVALEHATEQRNGSCKPAELSPAQRHIGTEISPPGSGHASAAKLSGGHPLPDDAIPESATRIIWDADVHSGCYEPAVEYVQPSAAQNDASRLVLVAAGHEMTKSVRPKQSKDKPRDGESRLQANGLQVSTVRPKTDICGAEKASVSDRHGHCSCVSDNQSTEAGACVMNNHLNPVCVQSSHNDGNVSNCSSAVSGSVSGTGECLPPSNVVGMQSNCDSASSASEVSSTSSLGVSYDVIATTGSSRHVESDSHRDVVSPGSGQSRSDRRGSVDQMRKSCDGAGDRRHAGGVGRGQKLIMLLDGCLH